jgi:hypothetical protein
VTALSQKRSSAGSLEKRTSSTPGDMPLGSRADFALRPERTFSGFPLRPAP